MKNDRYFHLAGWFGAKDVPPEPFPPGNQDITGKDHPSATDSYDLAKAAVFSDPYCGKPGAEQSAHVAASLQANSGQRSARALPPREGPLLPSGQENGPVAR